MTKRCEDKIDGRLERMMKRIEEALEADDCGESFRENDVYGVNVRAIQVRVVTSGGGPADGFDFYLDPEDGEILWVKYYYHEWADGATRQLVGRERTMVENLLGEDARWAMTSG